MSNVRTPRTGAPRHGFTTAVLAVAGMLVVGACSGKSTSANSGSTTTISSTTTSTSTTVPSSPSTTAATAPATTTPSTATPIAAQPVACTTGQLAISLFGVNGGLSHAGYVIDFKNTGDGCQLHGYPGLDGVSSDGAVVVSAQRTPNGYLGGPSGSTVEPNVELSSGQTASALFEGIDGPVASLGPCHTFAAVVITPPNETESVHLPFSGGAYLCYPQIHPVVAGTTGDAYTP